VRICLLKNKQNFTIFEKAIQEKISLKNESGEQTKAWCINDIQKAASGLVKTTFQSFCFCQN
jgi:hypothetical protein